MQYVTGHKEATWQPQTRGDHNIILHCKEQLLRLPNLDRLPASAISSSGNLLRCVHWLATIVHNHTCGVFILGVRLRIGMRGTRVRGAVKSGGMV